MSTGLWYQKANVASDGIANPRTAISSGVTGRCCIPRAAACMASQKIWLQAKSLANLSALLRSHISFFVIVGHGSISCLIRY